MVLILLAAVLTLYPINSAQARESGPVADALSPSAQPSGQSDILSLDNSFVWTKLLLWLKGSLNEPASIHDGLITRQKPGNPSIPDGGENGCFKMQKP